MPGGRRRPAPLDSVSSSYSGCRPCPPAALRGRSPLGSATGRCRGSAAPPHGPAGRHKVCAAQPGARTPLPLNPAGGRGHFLFLRAAARAPRPAPARRDGAAVLPARSSGTAQRRIAPPAGQGGKSPTHCPRQPLPRPSSPVLPPSSLMIQTGRSGRSLGDLCGLSEGPR